MAKELEPLNVEVKEKVAASVAIDLPRKYKGRIDREIPVDRISIKKMEDFIFNARMRGADDDSEITFVHDRFWNGYSHNDRLSSFSVDVGATIGGFPVMPEKPEKNPSFSVIPSIVFAMPVAFILIFILKLLGVG